MVKERIKRVKEINNKIKQESRKHTTIPNKIVEEYVTHYNDGRIFITPITWADDMEEHCWNQIISGLKYRTSWDWLKPVIDKIIKSIGVKTIDECTKEEWFYSTSITRMYIGVDIEIAYNYVCEYLLWLKRVNRNL